MFSDTKLLQTELARARAERSDALEEHRKDRDSWAVERKELLDRIMALSNPGTLREYRRPMTEAVARPAVDPRPAWPGYQVDRRPAVPARADLEQQILGRAPAAEMAS